ASRFLRHYIKRDAAQALTDESTVNAKGRLQEYAQDKLRFAPVYHLVSAEGPAHARTFTVEAQLDGKAWGTGVGSSKRIAEQAAARAALAALHEASSSQSAPAERKRARRRKSAAPSSEPPIEKEPGNG